MQPVNKWSIKGDHLFNEKQRISGYYGYDREATTAGPEGPATLPGLYSNYNDLHQSSDVLRLTWDWTLSPVKFNHFYAGGNNWRQDHKPTQEYIGNWQSKFCLGNVPNCNENLVNLFSGGNGNTYTTWAGQADNGSENTIYSYNDDFSWIKGAHTFKFGGAWQINHYNGFGRQCEAGCVGFSYTETGVPGLTDPTQGGNAFASFLLGARSYGPLMAVTGSRTTWDSLTDSISNPNNRIQPLFLLNQGFPPYTAPPFINPSVSNGTTVTWWQGSETTHPPTTGNFNFMVQRQLSSTMLVQGGYNGVLGSHLQTQLLDYNQDNPALLTAFGRIQQSTQMLNSQVGCTLAKQYGIGAPYPGFKGTVRQALRPYPQYTLVDTYGGQGDHSGHSTYHSVMIRFEK